MSLFNLSRFRELLSPGREQPLIGIDFGTRVCKLLQLTPGENQTVLAAAACETPDELLGDPFARLTWQFGQLPALLKAGGFCGRRVACCVPAAMAYCKHLQLSLPEQNAQEIVAAAIAEQLICDPRALEVRHRAVAVGPGGRHEVLAMAIGRGLVNRFMAGMKSAGLDLVALHPETLAVLRSFDPVTRRDSDGELTSVYLDVGASGTRVMVAHGREPVFVKAIGIGGGTLDQLVRDRTKCTLSEARAKRLAAATRYSSAHDASLPQVGKLNPAPTGLLMADAIVSKRLPMIEGTDVPSAIQEAAQSSESQPLMAVLERRELSSPKGYREVTDPAMAEPIHEAVDGLADEVAMCLRYHSTIFPGKRPDRCYFVGGESAAGDLAAFVARKLRLPAHVADPLASVGRTSDRKTPGVNLAEPLPGWAAVVGLCRGPTDL